MSSELEIWQRLRRDTVRKLERVQARIRLVADRGARDHAAALRRGNPQLADYELDLAIREVHSLEDDEVRLRDLLADYDRKILAARQY